MSKHETFSGCPHCGNKLGFAFGTCIDCGYNHISNVFKFITVHVDDLADDQYYLIQRHAEATRNRNK